MTIKHKISLFLAFTLFTALMLVFMCSASGLYWQNNMLDFTYIGDYGMPLTNDIWLDIPFENDDNSYGIIYGRVYDPVTAEYSTQSISITNTQPFLEEYAIYLNSEYTSFIQYLWFTYNTNIPELDTYLTQIDIDTFDLGCSSCYNEYYRIYDYGYNMGEIFGYNNGLQTGYDNGVQTGYNNGYNMGFSSGYSSGYNEGEIVGYDNGVQTGYNNGYNTGLEESKALSNGLKTIFSAPIYILTGILDFEILGFSLYEFILSLLTIMLVGFIVKSVVGFI